VHLCGDEVLIITIDSRTGRLNLQDTGDLAAAGRGPRFVTFSDRLNENPAFLMDALFRLRLSVRRYNFVRDMKFTFHQTIVDLAEQKANYLGFQSYRRRNILKEGRLLCNISCFCANGPA
jgi:mediator of RNA polymerase II transcription subunit 14